VLARYGHLEDIPDDPRRWQVKVRGAAKLAGTLSEQRDLAMLFRKIATVVKDTPEVGPVDSWQWTGPRKEFDEICDYLDAPRLPARAQRLANQRTH
jgi:hypothetical protein